MNESQKNNCENHWYAIRVTYNRELKVADELKEKGIEYFLPMRYKEVMKGERRIKMLVPAINNLIFIRSSREDMIEFKIHTPLPIRYIMDRETRRPIIISDNQMKNFIAVAGNYNEQIIYLDCDTATMKKGERVRITGGIFEGTIGEFVRVKGDRRVVVTIPGIAAVATTFIHPSLIERIEDQ
ncbi:MAG: UpxY family transcription antiterminator [Muribaculaceae bacterium]|nr:UpxY family transcription antiterminator [Muribaculaceae bacterium]